jgi:phospholipid/cholesterol/gamma-HCH transport system substrate-binding protein
MRDNLAGATWRLGIFMVVCLFGMFAMFAIFAQLRFQHQQGFNAMFIDVSGLKDGDFVRIAGVEVGKVKSIAVQPDTTVKVTFGTDDSVVLTQGSKAVIRYADLIGGRYLALEEGAGSTALLTSGSTIPVERTAPALDLNALIGGFRPLFRALDPNQVNALSGQLIQVLQGEGPTINSFLTQAAALTNTLANRDQLIDEVITNLNTVLGSLGDQSKKFDDAVASLSDLLHELAGRGSEISSAVAHIDSASASLADLLAQARPPLAKTIHETDRTAGIIVGDHDYVDNLLHTLPNTYQKLGRQGLYGDFFSFYICDILLKMNGKGGQPVYIKLAGQDSGRCTPK